MVLLYDFNKRKYPKETVNAKFKYSILWFYALKSISHLGKAVFNVDRHFPRSLTSGKSNNINFSKFLMNKKKVGEV